MMLWRPNLLLNIWEKYIPFQIHPVFGMSPMKEICFGEEIITFSNNTLLSVSWGETRFWVVLEEKDSLSKFSDEQ